MCIRDRLYSLTPSPTSTSGKVELYKEETKVYESSNPIVFRRIYYHTWAGNHDEFYQPLRIVEQAGANIRRRVTEYDYKNDFQDHWIVGQPLSIKISGGDKTYFSYFDNGLVKDRVENGIETRYDYHADGNLSKEHSSSVYDQQFNTYSYSNYFRGIPRTEIDEAGRRKVRVVNSDGTVRSESTLGQNGNWSYNYDRTGSVVKIVHPEANQVDTLIQRPSTREEIETSEDGTKKVVRLFDNYGRLVYEGASDRVSSNVEFWRSTNYRYDPSGRLIFKSHPEGISPFTYQRSWTSEFGTHFSYDGLGRITETRTTFKDSKYSNHSVTRTWDYQSSDSNFLRITATDGRGKKTITAYESFGEPGYNSVVEVVDGNGASTKYENDYVGRLKSVEKGGYKQTTTYNSMRLPSAHELPESNKTIYRYYPNGLIKKREKSNRKVDLFYYPDNQIKEESFKDSNTGETVSRLYEYNNSGYLSLMYTVNKDGIQTTKTQYSRDSVGKVLWELHSVWNPQSAAYDEFQIIYEYNQHGDVKAYTSPSGNRYDLNPNAYDQATKYVDENGEHVISRILYHPDGEYRLVRRNDYEVIGVGDKGLRTTGRYFRPVGSTNTDRRSYHVFSYDEAVSYTHLTLPTICSV